jgi:uncharacterized membrane protein
MGNNRVSVNLVIFPLVTAVWSLGMGCFCGIYLVKTTTAVA